MLLCTVDPNGGAEIHTIRTHLDFDYWLPITKSIQAFVNVN